jgi:hypothetical protein
MPTSCRVAWHEEHGTAGVGEVPVNRRDRIWRQELAGSIKSIQSIAGFEARGEIVNREWVGLIWGTQVPVDYGALTW